MVLENVGDIVVLENVHAYGDRNYSLFFRRVMATAFGTPAEDD